MASEATPAPLEPNDWSLAPDDLDWILSEAEARCARQVVELGAGAGTLVLARGLARLGVRLTTVEHDPAWAARVRTAIAAEGLEAVARVLDAPLAAHPLAEPGAVWYSAKALEDLPAEIDILIVDGPPGSLPGMERGRGPALEALGSRLAPGALVALDDAGREGERSVLERWEARSGFRFRMREAGRIAVGSAKDQ